MYGDQTKLGFQILYQNLITQQFDIKKLGSLLYLILTYSKIHY